MHYNAFKKMHTLDITFYREEGNDFIRFDICC